MIVLDASAAVELVLGGTMGRNITRRIGTEGLHAPHLLDVEVAQTLRRLALTKIVDARRAAEALDDYRGFLIERHPHDVLLPRVWELRANITAYDAVYVALAEALGCTLLTLDARLAKSGKNRATVEVIS